MHLSNILIHAFALFTNVDAYKRKKPRPIWRTEREALAAEKSVEDTQRVNRKGKSKGKKEAPPHGGGNGGHRKKCDSPNSLKAEIMGVPGSNFIPPPSGYVCMTYPNMQAMDFNMDIHVDYVEPHCSFQTELIDSCSIKILAANSCNLNDGILPHFMESNNPWNYTYYASFEEEKTRDRIYVEGGNGFRMEQNLGMAVVLYNKLESRIGCGILMPSKYDYNPYHPYYYGGTQYYQYYGTPGNNGNPNGNNFVPGNNGNYAQGGGNTVSMYEYGGDYGYDYDYQ